MESTIQKETIAKRTINEIFFDFVDPFAEEIELTDRIIKREQDALFTSFEQGFKSLKLLFQFVLNPMGGYIRFIKIQPKNHFEYVHPILKNRSTDFVTKCNRDYVYYNESKRGHEKFKSDTSDLTNWELLLVALTQYTDLWHKKVEQESSYPNKDKKETIYDQLKKIPMENVNLYIPKEKRDLNFLAFYSENNPKSVPRFKDKFLKSMMVALCLCGFSWETFYDRADEIFSKYLPRDYLRMRVIPNMYPIGWVKGKKSHKIKKEIKIEKEKQYIQEIRSNIEKFLRDAGWGYTHSLIDERSGYPKYWIKFEMETKEVVSLHTPDPITFLMSEYFGEKKHFLYEGRDVFSVWQMNDLIKKIGEDEAKRFERDFKEHPMYHLMKERLDLLLTKEFEQRLYTLRSQIPG